ncbi:MAG: DUF1684 domain-containing protein [Calditrichaeota bacterium]|nr:MAG: DUF1684 domain-containing protein [Calditrichota bacterium]
MQRTKWPFVLISISLFLISCQSQPKADPTYVAEINEWHQKRVERLKTETGWLNLAGLFWLQEGQNTFGSDTKNHLVFPEKAAPFLGTLILKHGEVELQPNSKVEILQNNQPVKKMTLINDNEKNTTVLNYGDLRWFVIKRGVRYGIRLRDLKHKLLDEFKGIERFAIDESWKVKALFEKYDPPKKIFIPDVTGNKNEAECFGAYVFEKDGKNYRIEPTGRLTGKSMFLVFGDATNRKSTYGGGRFLYLPVPDENNEAIIDFNKAYNPPCVFSPFATCPLPMEINILALEITAGEKNWGDAHH